MARKHKSTKITPTTRRGPFPYGDLITLLLAFFVVMYAISSINEGKFRVLSDSLQAAFRGTPRTLEPVQVGEKTRGSGADIAMTIVQQSMIDGQPRKMLEAIHIDATDERARAGAIPARRPHRARAAAAPANIRSPSSWRAWPTNSRPRCKSLVDANLVTVRRHEFWLEVEVKTDILFASGEANLSDKAIPALDALAATLVKYPNPVRVEGHTDNRPISHARTIPRTGSCRRRAPRAWCIASRAPASRPERLSVIGFGEYRPAQSQRHASPAATPIAAWSS